MPDFVPPDITLSHDKFEVRLPKAMREGYTGCLYLAAVFVALALASVYWRGHHTNLTIPIGAFPTRRHADEVAEMVANTLNMQPALVDLSKMWRIVPSKKSKAQEVRHGTHYADQNATS